MDMGTFGHFVSEKTKQKISNSLRGQQSPFKGHSHTESARLKLSIARAKQVFTEAQLQKRRDNLPKNENHWAWKGDNAGYTAIHHWVRRRLGTPKKCEQCGTTTHTRYEWANISKEYKRTLTDWRRLCKKCHNEYDQVNVNRVRGKNGRFLKVGAG